MLLAAKPHDDSMILLPNAMTWSAMGLVLVITLFFRFGKPWQLRNWDILLLFILTAPMLYLRDAQEERDQNYRTWSREENQTGLAPTVANLAAAAPLQPAGLVFPATFSDQFARHQVDGGRAEEKRLVNFGQSAIWRAYFWLLMGTAVLLFRSIVDLGLERRAAFQANLAPGGMLFFASVLLVVMIVKCFLPAWQGVPRQQHQSIVLTYLIELLGNSAYVGPVLALVCHTLIVALLVLAGTVIFENLSVGAAAAILYLLLPYSALHLTDAAHVVPAVFVLAAVVGYRSPILAGLSLGLGTCLAFFPAILAPAWIGFYFRRGHGRFLAAYLLVILAVLLYVAMDIGLTQAWNQAWRLTEWQAWKFAQDVKSDGLWNSVSLHTAYRIPLFVIFLTLMSVSAFWPHPKNLGQLISLSAVLILGVQFWYADAGGSYILWYLPLLILQTLRPALTEHRPRPIDPSQDRLSRAVRWVGRRIRKNGAPEEAAQSAPALT